MRYGLFDHRNNNDRYAVEGRYLNKVARAVNPSSFRRPGAYSQHEMQGHLAGSSSIPPTIIGIAVITSAENTCDVSSDSQESFDAPCRREALYKCRFRYYDFDERKWLEYDEELDLDASWTRDLSSTYSIDLPAMPPLKVGDQVVVGYDDQRGRITPLAKPRATYIARTSTSGIRGRCGVEVCTGDVQIISYDNDLDPTLGGCHDLELAKDDDDNPVVRKCANLSVNKVPGNSLILVHEDSVSGTLFTIGAAGETKLHKGRARGCHQPGGNMAYDLIQYDPTSEDWEFTGRVVIVQDPHYGNFVLPGEIIWIVQADGSSGGSGVTECSPELNPSSSNNQRPWFTLGSYGLTRIAKTTSVIGCNSYGAAEVFYHATADCAKSDSGCVVPVCNDWGHPADLAYAEEIKITFINRRWIVINEPLAILARATLYTDLQPTDTTIRVTLQYFMDRCSTETIEIVHNPLCLHGAEDDIVILARDRVVANGWMILAVKRHPHILLAETFSGGIPAYDGTTLGSGLVNVACRDTADDSVDLQVGAENIINVYNVHGKIRGNSLIFVIREEQCDDWYVLEPMMPIVSGQQVGALAFNDLTNDVDNVEFLAGFAGTPYILLNTITADNDFGWDADDNALTYAFLDADGNWKMFQVDCPV